MVSPYLKRFNRGLNRLGDVARIGIDSWGVKSDSRAADIAGVNEWIVTHVGGEVFTCTCPDFLGQVIIGNDLNNIKVDFGRTFYPCKHIIAVAIVEGYDYVDIIVDNLSLDAFDDTFDDTFRYSYRIFDDTFLEIFT